MSNECQLSQGNNMKTGLVAISLAASLVSIPAHADITGGGVLGAIAGGLLGSQVGQGNGRIAASALGAVLGFNAGQAQSYAQPYYAQPRYSPPPQVYYSQPPVVYYAPMRRWGDDDRRYYRRWGDDD